MERTKGTRKKDDGQQMNKQTQELALQVFHSKSFYSVNKKLVQKFGWEMAGFISNLIDKYNYFYTRGMLEDGAFFQTHANQSEQTSVTEWTIRKHKNKLKEMGILDTYMKGLPSKEFYKLDIQKLVDFVFKSEKLTANTLGILRSNATDSVLLYKENIYKENKEEKNICIENQKIQKNETINQLEFETLKRITPSQFETFWKIYPRKTDKGKSKSKWESICNKPDKERPTWDDIKFAIKKQRKSDRWKNPKFIPYPTTWLNQQRWLDDAEQMKGWEDNDVEHEPVNKVIPAEVINNAFPNETLSMSFYKYCFEPMRDIFDKDGKDIDAGAIATKLVNMYTQIKYKQKEALSPTLVNLLPGPISLLTNYGKWLNENDWIKDVSLNVLDMSSSLFWKYRRYEASLDNLNRDPITGVVCGREV